MGDEARYTIDRFIGVHQGLDEALMDSGLSPHAQNMDTTGGSLTVAKGCTRYAPQSLPGNIRTLAGFHNRAAGSWQLLAATDSALYVLQGGGWQALRTGLSNGLFASVNYQIGEQDVLILSNGIDPALIWNGSQLTQASGIPRSAFLALHYERLWAAGKPGEPDAVYWSRAYDPKDFTSDPQLPEKGGGMVLVPTWNGGSVRALMTLFGDVVVFKDYDIHRIIGTYPGNYEVRRVHGVVGPLAARSIVTDGTACYFWGRDGLCLYDGVRAVPIADQHLQGLIRQLSPQAAQQAVAAIHKGVLHLSLPSPGVVVQYDLRRQTYMLRRGIPVDAFLPYGDRLLFASGQNVYVWDEGEDNDGAPIEAFWQTPWTDLGRKDVVKTVTGLYLHGEGSGLIRATLQTEGRQKIRESAFPIGCGRLRIPVRLRGRRFRLRLENVDGSAFCIHAGVSIHMELEED